MLSGIVGSVEISFWPQLALVLFFSIFMVMAVRVFRTDSKVLEETARLPLDD